MIFLISLWKNGMNVVNSKFCSISLEFYLFNDKTSVFGVNRQAGMERDRRRRIRNFSDGMEIIGGRRKKYGGYENSLR